MIQEVEEKELWGRYLKQVSGSVFLLDWWWGEFQRKTGRIPYHLAWVKDEKVLAVGQVFFQPLLGSIGYGTAFRCPLFAYDVSQAEKVQIESEFLAWSKNAHKKQKWIFWRWEPVTKIVSESLNASEIFNRQPRVTCITDLSYSTDELLARMHEKTRYNVRLSLKKSLSFRNISALDMTSETFDAFWSLMNETSNRASIKSYNKKYYQQLFETARAEDGQAARMLLVYKDDKALATGIFIGSGNTFTYLFGASSSQDRNLMAPYYLHWRAMEYAMDKGFLWYDWWGINPENNTHLAYKKSWEGITRFKDGFGCKRVEYPEAKEFAIDNVWYKVYKLFKTFK